jgi:GTP-binding protein EngB required for normal cell division
MQTIATDISMKSTRRGRPIKIKNVSLVNEETKTYEPTLTQDLLDFDILENVELPKNNLNLCFVGGVSTGKSTILNSIFCEKLTECKIKRTTMTPTIYIENKSIDGTPFQINTTPSGIIFNNISEKNKELIEKSESGQLLTMDDYGELKFNVGNLNMNILQKNCVNVYDIPGLNDARTKDIYYQYLETNFIKFDIVTFIIDIYSGLNTSDEMEMLQFIANNIRHVKEHYGKNIYALVVVNKADDMQVNIDDESDLSLSGELKEMFEQVENTIQQEFTKKNIIDHLIGLVPLCALDAYLYRMVKKCGTNFKLTQEQILKIGVNECGKRFGTLKPETQEKKVLEVLSDDEFIDTMIKLSGFSLMENKLNKFLSHNNLGQKIIVDNLIFEVNKLNKLENCVVPLEKYDFDVIELFENYMKLYLKIKEINEDMFHKLMRDDLYSIINRFYKNMQFYNIQQIDELLNDYDVLNENILKKYYSSYDEIICQEYPYQKYLIDEILRRIKQIIDEYLISIINDTYSLEMIIKHLKRINLYEPILVTEIIEILIKSDLNVNYDPAEILKVLLDLSGIGVDIKKLIKRIIIDKIQEKYNSTNHVGLSDYEELIIKNMIYQKNGEICIQNFIQITLNVALNYVNHKRINKNIFLEEIEEHCKKPEFILDMYYLNMN